MWHQYRLDQLPNTFRNFFRKIERVKIGENAPVDARFYQLFDFGRNFRYLNGLLEMQNPDTPGGELSQGFREASRFKIAYSCAILRLLTRRDFFAKSAKNDEFLHFSTPEPIFLSRTIKTNVFVMKFWVVGASFSTVGVPIVEIFSWEASEADKIYALKCQNSDKQLLVLFF